ncbi:MAG: hypothetical protein QOK48_674 [Blastocatellia bacterium]|jgi:hypothetical protein|nr:hypothetical protein [Blastocatellia bacterium]
MRQSIWFLDRNTSLQFKAELPAAQQLLRIIFFARASGSFRKAGFIFPNLAPYSFDEQHASAENPVDTYAPSEAFVRNSEEGIHYSEKVALPRPEDQMVFLNLLGSIRLGYQLDKFF